MNPVARLKTSVNLRPLLFLSYARSDAAFADQLAAILERQGCAVWVDRSELLTGDDFVLGLQRELAGCDGLVLLLTTKAAESSWCQAKVQRALALKMPVLVARRDGGAVLPDALERLLRDVQRTEWSDAVEPAVGLHVRQARRRRLVRLSQRVGLVTVPVVLMVSAVAWGVASLNERSLERNRSQAVEDLRSATAAWSGARVRARLAGLTSDEALAQRLAGVASDPSATPIARLNALQAVDALREGRTDEWRFYMPTVDWSGGRLSDTLWANTTYGAGSIRDLAADRMRIAGIVLGSGPADGKEGLSLINVRIRDSDAWFLWIDGTQLIDVAFINSKLRGAQLDLSGAAGVRFVSLEESEEFLSTDVGIIEDSWIIQRRELPAPDVLDLAEPEQEILFDGIQFHRVRFEGEFKPQWFRKSAFFDCSFPPGLIEALRADGGHVIETSEAFVEEQRP